MGPTASGKTAVADLLADRLGAQLISADAFQAYRGFDIGTAKPVDPSRYELLDILDPTEPYGVGEFVSRARESLDRLFKERRHVIVTGGTGLYVRALFETYADLNAEPDPELRARLTERLNREGLPALVRELEALDPETSQKIDLKNPRRVTRAIERALGPAPQTFNLPPFVKFKCALIPEVATTDRSISRRLDGMMQAGFVEETQRLLESGVPLDAPAMRAIGYQTIAKLLRGELDRSTAIESILLETRQYAKRQRTWLRSEPNLAIIAPDDNARPQDIADDIELQLKEMNHG